MTKYDNTRSIQLIEAYKNGDDYAFTELYQMHEKMMHEIINKFKGYYYIDMDNKWNACNRGFLNAVNTYDANKGSQFHSYAYKCMTNRMIHEIKYFKHKGRKEMVKNSTSLNNLKQQKEDETEYIDLFSNAPDEYFVEDYPETKQFICDSIAKTRKELQPYVVGILTGDYTQSEVGRLVGMSKQAVRYQYEQFTKRLRESLLQNNIGW